MAPSERPIGAGPAGAAGLESAVARLLRIGTYAAIGLIAVGVLAMAATGRSPLDAAPPLDLGRLPADIAALRPAGFLWLGLLVMLATPSARVVASLFGYLRNGERAMALVATAILLVIAVGILAGLAE